MAIEALWSVSFGASRVGTNDVLCGAGMVVLETGRLLGGDSKYYYIGDYSVSGGRMRARITVHHYAGEPSSIFGPLNHFVIVAQGNVGTNRIELLGHLEDDPAQAFAAHLTRRAELP